MGMWSIPKGPASLEQFSQEEIDKFIEEVAELIVKKRMSVPAILALELVKPLSFVGAQVLLVFAPVLELLFDPQKLDKLNCVLSDRDRVEAMLIAIERKENKEGESDESR